MLIGQTVGPYQIVAKLGEGGMGEVYRARDSSLGREVALKVLRPEVANDRERLGRFAREARLLASLNHPNIGTIHGWEESTGVHAIVLELIEGPTLRDRIVAGPLPIDQALGIARQVADALEAAHDQGIVHRDLKPANILPGPFTPPTGQFTWLGQDGRVLGTLGQPDTNQGVELSPDGQRVVTLRRQATGSVGVGVLDAARGVPSLVTKTSSLHPIWSWDGSHLAYQSAAAAPPISVGVALTSAPWAGGGTPDVLRTDPSRWFNPVGWTRDGTLVWLEVNARGYNNIWQMSPAEPARAKQYPEQEGLIAEARLSRAGRWIAVANDQSGDFDIIVQPFPPTGQRWTVSAHGGRFPRWSADGHELYYLTRDLSQLMKVSVTGDPPVFGTPHEMFKVNLRPIPIDSVVFSTYEYDVDSKNSRFIINQLISEPPQTLDLVLNWIRK